MNLFIGSLAFICLVLIDLTQMQSERGCSSDMKGDQIRIRCSREDMFAHLPESLSNFSHEIVQLYDDKLKSSKTLMINVSNYLLSNITEPIFVNVSIGTMTLYRNNLQFIGHQTLSHVLKLTSLYIQMNSLDSIAFICPQAARNFSWHSTLTTMDLSDNKITYVSYASLSCLVKLKSIGLKNNRLHDLNGNKLFGSLNSVTSLVVSGNKLDDQLKLFHNLNNLTSIILDDNQMTRLTERTFNCCVSLLNQLSIDSNRLSVIESNSFLNLVELKQLKLANNRIKRIETFAFRGPANLQKLALDTSFSKLKSIEGNFLFYGINQIDRLSISFDDQTNATSLANHTDYIRIASNSFNSTFIASLELDFSSFDRLTKSSNDSNETNQAYERSIQIAIDLIRQLIGTLSSVPHKMVGRTQFFKSTRIKFCQQGAMKLYPRCERVKYLRMRDVCRLVIESMRTNILFMIFDHLDLKDYFRDCYSLEL